MVNMLEIALDVLVSLGGFSLALMLWSFYPGKIKVIGITAIVILVFLFACVHEFAAFEEAQIVNLGRYKGPVCFGWMCL